MAVGEGETGAPVTPGWKRVFCRAALRGASAFADITQALRPGLFSIAPCGRNEKRTFESERQWVERERRLRNGCSRRFAQEKLLEGCYGLAEAVGAEGLDVVAAIEGRYIGN